MFSSGYKEQVTTVCTMCREEAGLLYRDLGGGNWAVIDDWWRWLVETGEANHVISCRTHDV